jgi:hypothetical protein
LPATDAIAPTISFSITGPGVRTTITNQELADRKQLNLKFNESYDITCIVSDAGGVNRALVSIPVLTPPRGNVGEFKDQNNNILTPVTGATRLTYTVLGNPRSPLSGFIINGKLSVNETLGFDITIQGADFGGRAGTVNNSILQIHCLGDREGGIINL